MELVRPNLYDLQFGGRRPYHAFFWKAGIFEPAFIRTDKGRFKGYPLRTYSGGTFTAGYSDHFPAYLFLLKEVKE